MSPHQEQDKRFNRYMLEHGKAGCYGLAAASFALILQVAYTSPDKITWPHYGLLSTVFPLIVIGTVAHIAHSNPKKRPRASAFLVDAGFKLIMGNIIFLVFCLWQVDKILGMSLAAGAAISGVISTRLEKKLDQDDASADSATEGTALTEKPSSMQNS